MNKNSTKNSNKKSEKYLKYNISIIPDTSIIKIAIISIIIE